MEDLEKNQGIIRLKIRENWHPVENYNKCYKYCLLFIIIFVAVPTLLRLIIEEPAVTLTQFTLGDENDGKIEFPIVTFCPNDRNWSIAIQNHCGYFSNPESYQKILLNCFKISRNHSPDFFAIEAAMKSPEIQRKIEASYFINGFWFDETKQNSEWKWIFHPSFGHCQSFKPFMRQDVRKNSDFEIRFKGATNFKVFLHPEHEIATEVEHDHTLILDEGISK